MATPHERLIEWLRDAHAAEQQAQTLYEKTAGHMLDYPEFRTGLERHAKRSGDRAASLEVHLEQLGKGPSLLKNLTGQFTAISQTLSGYIVGDEPVKAALAVSAFAQTMVSSSRILIVGGKAAGAMELVRLCEHHLSEDLAFRDWMDEQVEVVCRNYLAFESEGSQAAPEFPAP